MLSIYVQGMKQPSKQLIYYGAAVFGYEPFVEEDREMLWVGDPGDREAAVRIFVSVEEVRSIAKKSLNTVTQLQV